VKISTELIVATSNPAENVLIAVLTGVTVLRP
jgi:hypothetical protein